MTLQSLRFFSYFFITLNMQGMIIDDLSQI
jgi:hypothetical protein